jgi:condensin complex subunit 2
MVRQGDMNFTMATSALDAGTKIYINRVDCVQSDAQKVANAIVQALDNKSSKKGGREDDDKNDEDNPVDNDDLMENPEDSNRKAKKKPVVRKKKSGSKIVQNEESLSLSKLETNVEIDPIFFKLTTSHDMGNVNGLFLTNLPISSNGSLIMDSNAPNELSAAQRKAIQEKAKADISTRQSTIVMDKPIVDLIRDCCAGTGSYARRRAEKQKDKKKNHYRILHDKFLNEFLFCRREADLEVDYGRDRSGYDLEKSEFTFDINAEVEDEETNVLETLNLSFDNQGGDDDDLMRDLEGAGDNDDEEMDNENVASLQKSILSAVNMESMPDLKKLLAPNGNDYSYFKKIPIHGSCFGPNYWKKNVWLRMQQAKERKAAALANQEPDLDEDGQPIPRQVPPTTIKKKKADFPLLDFTTLFPQTKTPSIPSRRHCERSVKQKLKLATLEKWSTAAEFIVLPHFKPFDPQSLLKPFNKADSYFSLYDERERMAKVKEAKRDRSNEDVTPPDSPIHSDFGGDEMPASQELNIPASQASQDLNPFGITNTATQGFMGDNLVDEPNVIPYVHLQYAKYAKRIDVKRLKRAIMNRIVAGSHNIEESFTGPTACSTMIGDTNGVNLTQVYNDLPQEIPAQMTKEMSPAIAFVTLLHLANEHVSLLCETFLTCY